METTKEFEQASLDMLKDILPSFIPFSEIRIFNKRLLRSCLELIRGECVIYNSRVKEVVITFINEEKRISGLELTSGIIFFSNGCNEIINRMLKDNAKQYDDFLKDEIDTTAKKIAEGLQKLCRQFYGKKEEQTIKEETVHKVSYYFSGTLPCKIPKMAGFFGADGTVRLKDGNIFYRIEASEKMINVYKDDELVLSCADERIALQYYHDLVKQSNTKKKTIHDKYVEAIKAEDFEKAGKLLTRMGFRLATKAEKGEELNSEEVRELAETILSYRKWSDEKLNSIELEKSELHGIIRDYFEHTKTKDYKMHLLKAGIAALSSEFLNTGITTVMGQYVFSIEENREAVGFTNHQTGDTFAIPFSIIK